MSERTQRILWILEAVVAACLTVATVYVYRESRGAKHAGRIAYTVFDPGFEAPRILTCDLDGGNTRRLTESGVAAAFPLCEPFSPESNRPPRIAFLRWPIDAQPGGSHDAHTTAAGHVVGVEGGEAARVSGEHVQAQFVAPSWSPDGKQLVFAGVEDLNGDGEHRDDEAGIYVSDLGTGQTRRVADAEVMGLRLSWSPRDSRVIVPVKKADAPVAQAHILNVDTGKLAPILNSTALCACWSPDGEYIAAYSLADGKIHVLQSDGAEELQMEGPSGHVVELVWTLAYPDDGGEPYDRAFAISTTQLGESVGQLSVWSAPPGETGDWVSLADVRLPATYVTVSPDGRRVAYSSFTDADNADLYLLELDDGTHTLLTSGPGFKGLATWIPGGW